MEFFVDKDSIVRKIWSDGDTILLIFAGSAAEFALNKAVDWLYFTGRLPADPLARLFSTVSYAQKIVFAPSEHALAAIDKIGAIHKGVEKERGQNIPDWAYRDVLFMLMDYSIRAFELLERKLTLSEKEEIIDVFYRLGMRMEIKGLPGNFNDWLIQRDAAMQENMINGEFTKDLYKQYKKHLGWFRYFILKQSQILLVPDRVNKLLSLGYSTFPGLMLKFYKISRILRVKTLIKNLILPPEYKEQIAQLDNSGSLAVSR